MIATKSVGRAQLRSMTSSTVALMLAASACGGGTAEEPAPSSAVTTVPVTTATPTSADPAPTPTPPAPGAPAPPTAAQTVAPTSPPEPAPPADPWAVTEPIDITIDWDCDGELIDRGAYMVAACTSGRIEPWFRQTNWFVSFQLVRDDDGDVVAIDGAANGYSGDCMWNRALDSTLNRAPLVDGKATFGGVVFGEGRCEGLRFVYENTIDIEAGTSVTSGVIEPIP